MGPLGWTSLILAVLSSAHGCLFSEHLAKYVNNSIDVCDDFYDHVCSSVTANEELFSSKAARKLQEKIAPFMLKEIQVFMDEHEVQLKKADLYKILLRVQKMDAWLKYILTEEFQKIEKKFKSRFDFWKSMVVTAFKEAQWTKRYPALHKRLENAALVSYEQPSFNLTENLLKMVQNWNTCANSSEFESHCFRELEDELAVTENRLPSYQTALLPRFDQLNAGFSTVDSTVLVFPLLYTLDYENDNYMMGSLLFIFGHELGHSFFFPKYSPKFPDPGQPSNAECFIRTMLESCEIFFGKKSTACFNTGQGTTFGEDASDWVGMKTITTMMETVARILPKYETEIWKQVLYAHAIRSCKLQGDMGNTLYSPAKIRVNGIFRQFSGFARTFNCTYGNRMVKEEKCDPLTGPLAPQYKKLIDF